MKMYTVSVEKTLYCTGSVAIQASSAQAAENKVKKQINSGHLQTTAVVWSDPDYQDGSFQTTGDVE